MTAFYRVRALCDDITPMPCWTWTRPASTPWPTPRPSSVCRLTRRTRGPEVVFQTAQAAECRGADRPRPRPVRPVRRAVPRRAHRPDGRPAGPAARVCPARPSTASQGPGVDRKARLPGRPPRAGRPGEFLGPPGAARAWPKSPRSRCSVPRWSPRGFVVLGINVDPEIQTGRGFPTQKVRTGPRSSPPDQTEPATRPRWATASASRNPVQDGRRPRRHARRFGLSRWPSSVPKDRGRSNRRSGTAPSRCPGRRSVRPFDTC